MPLFDPSGRPFTPGQLVGVKKLSDYPSLNEAEFKEVSRQLEEGLSAGVGAGAEWSFAPSWSVGATLRYSNWFFPESPSPLPLNDPASLSGRVDMIALSIALAYRIAL